MARKLSRRNRRSVKRVSRRNRRSVKRVSRRNRRSVKRVSRRNRRSVKRVSKRNRRSVKRVSRRNRRSKNMVGGIGFLKRLFGSSKANSNEPNSNEPNSNQPNSNEPNSNQPNSNEPLTTYVPKRSNKHKKEKARNDLLISYINDKLKEGINNNTPMILTYKEEFSDGGISLKEDLPAEGVAAKYGVDDFGNNTNNIVLAIKLLKGRNKGWYKYVPIEDVSGDQIEKLIREAKIDALKKDLEERERQREGDPATQQPQPEEIVEPKQPDQVPDPGQIEPEQMTQPGQIEPEQMTQPGQIEPGQMNQPGQIDPGQMTQPGETVQRPDKVSE